MAFFDKIKNKASELSEVVNGKAVDMGEWVKTLPETLHGYADRYNPEEMWEKLKTQAAKAGQELVMMVLTMFYTIRDRIQGTNVAEDVPMSDVLLLAGAIAYFVCPADLIPDVIPGVGYSDDLTALTFAYKKAFGIFTAASKGTALEKTAELLGDKFDPETAAKMTSKIINQ
ncbi:MAG: DUF1232 domain-containing protein [Duncaniella sp.]|nr:DUF1232 domain-containing protein [Duncaniella sp.]